MYIAELSYTVSDTLSNAVIKKGLVSSTAEGLEACLEKLTTKTSNAIFMTLLTQKSIRNIGKLNAARSAFLDKTYPLEVDKDLKKVLKNSEYPMEYYVTITNPAKTHFIALGIIEHHPDIDRYIGMEMRKNLYPNVDVTEQIDPHSPSYLGYSTIGVYQNGVWYITKSSSCLLYNEDLIGAKKEFLHKVQNFPFFEDSTVNPKKDVWESGLFTVVDSNYIVNMLPKVEEFTKEEHLKCKQNNLIAFEGLPLFRAYENIYKSRMDRLTGRGEFSKKRYGHLVYKAIKKGKSVKSIRLHGSGVTSIRNKAFDYCIIIAMVTFDSGKEELQFFFWQDEYKNSLYKLNALEDVEVPSSMEFGALGNFTVSQIQKIYPWNFLYVYLQDALFWTSLIEKKNGEYLHLEQIL